jgi:iron complex outermembrane receptor protein
MTLKHPVTLFAGVSLACLASLWAASASAQDAPDATAVDEIIVTAQKREERLQDVPMTMSVVGEEQVAAAGGVNLTQLSQRIPGFYGGSAGATRPQLYIRGIGSRQFDAGSEASVGVFVDEVYLGRTAGALGVLRDVERVEVLKGPQGTLYGRNTIAGAINIITKSPTDTFEAEVEAGVGNYDAYNLFGVVSGPVAGDKVTARLAAWRTFSEGYMKNTFTGNTAQGTDHYGARLRVDIRPTDSLTFGLLAEVLRDDGYSFAGENEGTAVNPNAVFLARPGAVSVKSPDRYSEALNDDNLLNREVETYSAKGELETSIGTITSITAYRHNHAIDDRDFDNSILDVVRQVSDEESRQFTQELRLTSDPDGPLSFGGHFDWIVGAFYYNDRSSRQDTFHLGPDSVIAFLTGGPQVDIAASRFRTESVAVFAQGTVKFNDQWELTLGGRYSEDKKEAASKGLTTAPGVPLVAAPFSVDDLQGDFSAFNPRVTLAFKATDNLNFYASYNQGFKSGGFQYVPFSANQARVVFRPESLDAYEAGFKSQLFNGRLTLNGAVFYYEYEDLQVLRVIALPPPSAAATLITNAASSTVRGAEFEAVVRPTDAFEFNLAYAYTDGQYEDFQFNATTDYSGTRMVRSPEHSLNVGGQYTFEFGGDSELRLRADYAYLSEFYFEPGEQVREPGYGLLDLTATYSIGDVKVTAFMANATDEYYRRTVLQLPGQLIGYAGPPRTFGIKLNWKFGG